MSSLEALALRCLLPGFEGTTAPDWLRRRAAEGLGGVVLYGRNLADHAQTRALTDALHAERPALLVAIDEEGGDVTRLEARTGSSYPGNLALGEAADMTLTGGVAAAIGADLAAAGVDLNFAPVADVNSNAMNPVIGVRSFGSDADPVAQQTAAWVQGLQAAGVAACAKHFPGHGDTAVDSHLDLPVAGSDPRQAGALKPFEAAIAVGVRAVMSAHIVVRSLDEAPATISHAVMTRLLRHELGFTGLAITDGLDMRGLSNGRGIAEGAVLAMIAGCDALCVGGGPSGPEIVDEIVSALVDAVRLGRMSETRLREAAARVDGLAAWRGVQGTASQPRVGIGLEAARRALRSDGDVRVRDHAVVRRFDSGRSIAAGAVPWGVAGALSARGVHVTDGDPELQGSSLVLVVRDLHGHAGDREQVEATLLRRPDAILVEMGVPACRPAGARAYIATYGSARVCAEAAAEVMRP